MGSFDIIEPPLSTFLSSSTVHKSQGRGRELNPGLLGEEGECYPLRYAIAYSLKSVHHFFLNDAAMYCLGLSRVWVTRKQKKIETASSSVLSHSILIHSVTPKSAGVPAEIAFPGRRWSKQTCHVLLSTFSLILGQVFWSESKRASI